MKIAIIAATDFELADFKSSFRNNTLHNIDFSVHGVGIMMSTYYITKLIQNNYDLIVQIGIAGTFKKEIELGEVVYVKQDKLADTGVEDNEKFIDVFELDFVSRNENPFKETALINTIENNFLLNLRNVNAITVNTCSGNSTTIKNRIEKYDADIETMEGACLHYVCLKNNIPFVQLRSISNVIEPRNKENWNISLALKNLHLKTTEFIQTLS
jgi:futalosine hydrolase